jgi:hypothetical protein
VHDVAVTLDDHERLIENARALLSRERPDGKPNA